MLLCSHPMVTSAAAGMPGAEHDVVNLLFCRIATPPHVHAHIAASCVAVAEAVADGGFCIAKASQTLMLLYEPGYSILGMVSMRRYRLVSIIFTSPFHSSLPDPSFLSSMRPLAQEAQFFRTKSIG